MPKSRWHREKLSLLSRLGSAFNRCNFSSFCLKPLHVKCSEYLLKRKDIVAVLHSGFGKSLLFSAACTGFLACQGGQLYRVLISIDMYFKSPSTCFLRNKIKRLP